MSHLSEYVLIQRQSQVPRKGSSCIVTGEMYIHSKVGVVGSIRILVLGFFSEKVVYSIVCTAWKRPCLFDISKLFMLEGLYCVSTF